MASTPWSGLARAGIIVGGVIASYGAALALTHGFGGAPEIAITAAVLAMTLPQRTHLAGLRPTGLIAAELAGVALSAAAVGWLFVHIPLLGAVVFTAGMFGSVYLRNFDANARTAGALIALPLLAMLIVPPPSLHAPGGPPVDIGLVIAAGLIALAASVAVQWCARRTGIRLAPAGREPSDAAPPRAPGRTSPHTRMALQMAVALAAAFATGFLVFPGHWAWCVLTAFIVCSGARGRGDALYKGVLRLAGACAGTLAAAAFSALWLPTGVADAGAIFAVLFLGIWLREINYAYWAACMTLILALLAPRTAAPVAALLGVRIEAIAAGAVCAVIATWFVFPIRTEAVIRSRLNTLLISLDELVAHAHLGEAERAAAVAASEHHARELLRVAPPVQWHRRLFARRDSHEHPARWIDRAVALEARARDICANGTLSETERGRMRRAIGLARRAIGNHGKSDPAPGVGPIGASLEDVHAALSARPVSRTVEANREA